MNDDPRLFDAFDDCLTRLAGGASVDDCLERYPDLAADLAPMLDAAQKVGAAGRAPHHVQMRSRARFLAAAASRRPAPLRGGFIGAWLGRAISTAITLSVGFLLGTTGLYYASASTLPGDSLYGVKRAFEDARLQMASNAGQRFTLEEGFNERRAAELEEVLAQDRAVVVTFGGVLTGRSDEAWQIGGFNLQVTPDTRIIGDPQPGFYVSVVAENRDGVLVALELESEEVELIGMLERSGGQWSIGGASFVIGPDTVVSGDIAPGVTAAARLRTLHTGERVALSVVTLAPTPSSSPTPSPSLTPLPSNTPRPTVARAPTRTATQPPALAPTQAAPQAQPSLTSAPGQDANANAGEDDNGGNSGPGGGDDDNSNSGSGSGEDNEDDNSGPGGGNGEDGDDEGDDHSGHGGGGDSEDDDNSGSGGGGDDD